MRWARKLKDHRLGRSRVEILNSLFHICCEKVQCFFTLFIKLSQRHSPASDQVANTQFQHEIVYWDCGRSVVVFSALHHQWEICWLTLKSQATAQLSLREVAKLSWDKNSQNEEDLIGLLSLMNLEPSGFGGSKSKHKTCMPWPGALQETLLRNKTK